MSCLPIIIPPAMPSTGYFLDKAFITNNGSQAINEQKSYSQCGIPQETS